jgi:hypothetical protein
VALTEGQTTNVTIVFTAEDGTTAKTYTLSVTRAVALSNDATLSGLAISSGQLSPAFAAGTTAYTVSVSYSVSSVTLTPTTTSTKATVKINGSAVTSGSTPSPIPLTAGQTTAVGIVVTAEVGRFITEDPARADPNWYAYCVDNPLRYTDLAGLDICYAAIGVATEGTRMENERLRV